jgi:DNA topoisomerase-1
MITVRSGRFGPYVTDGETNASLRTGEDPDTITLERAVELLTARRERVASGEVGAPKKRPPRKAAKKATPKKAPSKKR